MPGHGTVIAGSSGQDDASVAVDNNGGSSNYDKRIQTAYNNSGGTVNAGDVVIVDWDGDNERVQITGIGKKATGSVASSGDRITITDSGDTALSGTVTISSSYGENEGWGGAENVNCGNVEGDGSYLCE